jgi:hypothetical protein
VVLLTIQGEKIFIIYSLEWRIFGSLGVTDDRLTHLTLNLECLRAIWFVRSLHDILEIYY